MTRKKEETAVAVTGEKERERILTGLKKASSKYDAARSDRDERIRLANEAGLTPREIAPAVGVSHMTVRTIIASKVEAAA